MEVWVDSDMGADDLFALQMLSLRATIAGVSTSFGVTTLPRVWRNAMAARAAFGWRFPLHAGAGRAILGGRETAERILGADGIRSRGEGLPAAPEGQGQGESDAADGGALAALSAWLAGPTAREVLALGPLTNLAILALAHPERARQIRRITWMGGARTRGNHTPAAEFNAFADPEAVAILLARRIPLRMIDLDACRQVVITEADRAALAGRARPGGPAARFADLLGGWLDIARERGRSAMPLYDPVAAAALLQPECFTFRPVRLEIDLADAEERGRTRVAPAPPALAEVVETLDAEPIRRGCLAALEAAG